MKKPRLYIDTSVFGGVFDIEFEHETNLLFEMVKNGEIICVYSDLCELEMENAPLKVRDHFLNIEKSTTEFVEITEEINQLAELTLQKKLLEKLVLTIADI